MRKGWGLPDRAVPPNTAFAAAGARAWEAALLAPLAGRIYDHAPRQNAINRPKEP